LIAGVTAAVAANVTYSNCDGEINHKVKHQDLKNSDPVAWARDSKSKFIVTCNKLYISSEY
jgi:hypothetical protein